MVKKHAFTLAEIMVVLAIVATTIALAIPALLRARHNANQLAAVSSCRTICNALQQYYTNSMPHQYPDNLAQITSPQAEPPYINAVLAGGVRQGYQFTYTPADNSLNFALNAGPLAVGYTGTNYYFTDQSGVIRVNVTGPAGPGDRPIE